MRTFTWGRGCEELESRRLLALNPTPFEQELLESINRMRLDPQAELDVIFAATTPNLIAYDRDVQAAIDYFDVSRELLLDQWSELTPTAPIALNEALTEVAAAHNIAMRDADVQAHEIEGEPGLGQRARDAGYRFRSLLENVFAYGESPMHTHAGFVVDWGEGPGGIQDPAGHRDNIMDPAVFDVGIAVLQELDPSTEVGPYLITQDFGIPRTRGNPFVLGVAYTDNNRDGIFNAGEGIGNATITITGDNGTFTTTSWDAGGYQLRVPAGVYEVIASGGSLGGTYSAGMIAVGTDNVRINFETQTANRSPTARADVAFVNENTSLRVDVLNNDSDSDGTLNINTLAIASQPTHGRATISNGELRYTPSENFTGTDSFTYTVRDNTGATSNVGVVTMHVIDTPNPPNADSAVFDTDENVPLRISATPYITAISAPLDWESLAIVSQPANGTAEWIVETREFVFTPDDNYSGETAFEYLISDTDGRQSAVATMVINVASVNLDPEATPDVATFVQGSPIVIDVAANDRDPDGTLAGATLQIVRNGDNGTATSTGTTINYFTGAGFSGRDVITYRLVDAEGGVSNETTLTLFVTHVARPWQNPHLAVDVIPDGVVSPLDALTVIGNFGMELTVESSPPFLDTDGNNAVGPIDALLVINALGSNSASSNGVASPGPQESAREMLFSLEDVPVRDRADRDQEDDSRFLAGRSQPFWRLP
ncbi:MAG: Ig-like domain-containing protein [Planctomycetota bacterium]